MNKCMRLDESGFEKTNCPSYKLIKKKSQWISEFHARNRAAIFFVRDLTICFALRIEKCVQQPARTHSHEKMSLINVHLTQIKMAHLWM